MAVQPKDLVRAAMEAGKGDTKDGVAWIKQHHGVTMRAQVFGRIRTQLQQEGVTAGNIQVKGVAVRPEIVIPNGTPTKPSLLKLLTTVNSLRTEYGQEQLVDALEALKVIAPQK